MAVRRSLVLGAATNWLAFVASLAVSFFMAPYLIRSLGDARYGIFRVGESLLAYFTLFDLGIAAGLVRFVARHQALEDRATLNRLVSASLAVFCVASVVMLGLGGAIVAWITPGLERRADHPGDVGLFMAVMLLNLAVTLPLSVFPTILDGLQRFGSKSLVRLLVLGLRVGAIVAVMEQAPSLWALAMVLAASNLLEHALMIALAYRFFPGLAIDWRAVDWATLRQVQRASVDAFLAMLAGRITVQTGAIVVGGSLSAVAAAHYAIAAGLVELAKNLLRTITATLTPAISEREARGDYPGIRLVVLQATRWVLYLVLPIQLAFIVLGHPFLERWIGKVDYAQSCYPSLVILSSTLTLAVAQSVTSRMLYGLGQLRLFSRLALAEAGLNLILSLLLVQFWGLEGVAWAVAIPNLGFCLAVIVTANRIIGLPLMSYWLHGWVKPLLAMLPLLALWAAVSPVDARWDSLLVTGLAGAVLYAAVVVILEWKALRMLIPESGPRWPVRRLFRQRALGSAAS